MKDSGMLRTAKVGGFNKEDVLTYVDELNAKIESLTTQLEKAKSDQSAVKELENYKSEVERLKERLAETDNALSEARTEKDALRSEMEEDKGAVSEENDKLKGEIESLKAQLEEALNKPDTVEVPINTVDTSEMEIEIENLKTQLENAKEQMSEMSGEMSKLTADISSKAKTIEELKLENNELRLQADESGFSQSFDMGALFSEAQATAKKIVIEARTASDKLVKDAKTESDKIIREANAKADRITSEAERNAAAKEKEAFDSANDALDSASRLKSMYRSEIEKLESKLSEAIASINLTTEKLKNDIEQTKSTVSGNAYNFIDGRELLTAETKIEDIIGNTGNAYDNMDSIGSYSSDYTDIGSSYYTSKSVKNAMSETKNTDNEIDDILNSFAIDPSSDDEDSSSSPSPVKPSLGFNLDDLAKLAEEAEKDV